MQVTQTLNEGLRREFKVFVPAADIETQVEVKLREVGQKARIKGFRPGKVPMPVLRQQFGQSVMGEVLETVVSASADKTILENNIRPAMQPKVEVTSFSPGADLEFLLKVEALPEIEPVDLTTIELERWFTRPSDQSVDDALNKLATNNPDLVEREGGAEAQKGDVLTIDFAGTVDGKARDGMKAEGFQIELGSGSLIDTFEDQLLGAKAGDARTVNVTFPENYQATDLQGKAAVFEVTVKVVSEKKTPAIDDALAKKLGFDDKAALDKAVREQLVKEYNQLGRLRLKRLLLDALADKHSFAVPAGMVDVEFDAIWRSFEEERKAGRLAPEDEGKSDDDLKAEYRSIAERRVRLGLLLSEIGRRNNIQVTADEMNRAVMREARQFPGQERQVIEFYQKNPQAADQLRAPIYEDKVVDFILEIAKITNTEVSLEQLTSDPEETGGAAGGEAKPKAKKASKKKAAEE
jgi:trigger factor